MHSKFSRLVVLFVLLVCLPLQGAAAVAMPACQAHGQKVEVHVNADQTDAMSGCDHHAAKQESENTSCDQCFFCFLGSVQAIISFVFPVQVMAGTQKFSIGVAEKPQSVSSLLFRPPILAFA